MMVTRIRNIKNMKMKKYYNLALSMLIGLVLITACENPKELPTIDLTGVDFVAPVISNAATGNVVLDFNQADTEFEKIEWSSAQYGQQLSVGYNLQVASSTTFEDAQDLAQTGDENASITVKQVNDAALLFGLDPFVEGTIYFRVVSNITGIDDTILESTEITRTVTPYVTDFASIYMIGAALKGWDPILAVELYGIGFKQYEVVAEFHNGEAFRFFEQQDWGPTSYNWTYFDGGTVDANFESAADGDTNLRFIGTTGFYRISVDLSAKTIAMEALSAQPTLFIVGAGVPEAGWGWTTPINMSWVQDGIFEAETQLLANDGSNGAAFRFFTGFDDWGSGLNYPYYVAEGYEIDKNLQDALDGDNNFMFVGASGHYKITVNDIAKTIVVSEAGTAGPPKYLVGAGVPDAGWGWATPIELEQVQVGVYEGTTSFANDAFRVFAAFDDWGSGKNYPTYISDGYTIDANFEDALDGDNNFKFIGTPGTYKFILNENTKTITLE